MARESKARPPGPELFIGLVGAVGTDLETVTAATEKALRRVGYTPTLVRVSDLLDEVDPESIAGWPDLSDAAYDERISTRMTAGDLFREALGRGEALAMFAVVKISSLRRELEAAGVRRRAYVIRSMKHPDEVDFFRDVYGKNFFVISAYSPQPTRVASLAKEIARDRKVEDPEEFESIALNLVRRDKLEPDKKLGQAVRDAFPKADCFVDASLPNGKVENLEREVRRFIEIIFGHPYQTPTPVESAMFHAQAAALRSAALGRQVGAALVNEAGEIIAVGTNEVPKPFGGQYGPDDANDNRDFRRTRDDSREMKELVAAQILHRLRGDKESEALLSREVTTDEFVARLKGTRAQSLIEFERAVHAEMAAILDAARRGQSVAGSSLYTTTFPCHECARHIVGAGIKRVVYIDPYPKSLALQLHDDAIEIDPDDPPTDKIPFEPFVGVAPRRFLDLFTYPTRRDPDGARFPAEPTQLPRGLNPLRAASAEDGSETRTCSACGAGNPPGAKYCNDCGIGLDESTKAQEDRPTVGAGTSEDATAASSALPTAEPAETSEPKLSDPVITFQEVFFITEFQDLLAVKGVRVKREEDDG